ncbi:MAG: hypothetical protein JWQ14_895 [Adhaeribacter sp.]|nr:hypothetical protein [Adhaeribacter sp.]
MSINKVYYWLLLVFTYAGVGLSGSYGQAPTKQLTDREQVWLGYFNQSRLSNRFSLWLDVHARRNDFLDRWAQTIVRPGLTYHISDHTRFTAGYAYISSWPASESEHTIRPEHRPWQQINWSGRSKKLQTNQWVRLEERFNRHISNDELQEGYGFNFRARYMIALMVPLKGDVIQKGIPFLVLNDEVHVNFGKEILYNYFDQNRLFAGFGFPFAKDLNAQLGYMQVFQQLPAGNRFYRTHALRLFIFHTLDFRKKDPSILSR